MTKLTRRGFLAKTSIGAAALGALIAFPNWGKADHAEAAPELVSTKKLDGLIVAHVRNVSKGEIALMIDTRAIVFRDRALVARLIRRATG
jgi:hypothetical protein